ncbi:class I SAM-dependent methyltransferase [Streptomyces sp. NPDC005774]|uniref:class I SAM-dependent methyltransferase n=1 Tax=Streptomyces sp. NPDC005774 TaxID=3364728 RepID=UPI003673650C
MGPGRLPVRGRRDHSGAGEGAGRGGRGGARDRVLDVAAGTGNAAIPAAPAGADVIAADLAPELLETGRRSAEERGARLRRQEADAEALPFDDGAFDTVISCVGVMFAPHHEAAGGELLHVCRPGGTIGLLSWTPGGFVGRMPATVKPYAPPPPPGAQPPPLWGDPEHVRALFGDRVTDETAGQRTVAIERFATPEEFRDYFKQRYGPVISVYKSLADEPERVAALDTDLAGLARRHDRGTGEGRPVMNWKYLLYTAHRSPA